VGAFSNSRSVARTSLDSAEVEGGGLDPFAVLHRGVDPFGESRRDLRPALAANPAFGAVLGDLDTDGREVEDLAAFAPGGMEFPDGRTERLTAFGAALVGSDAVLDDVVGIGPHFSYSFVARRGEDASPRRPQAGPDRRTVVG